MGGNATINRPPPYLVVGIQTYVLLADSRRHAPSYHMSVRTLAPLLHGGILVMLEVIADQMR
jgi:hypothetical protein